MPHALYHDPFLLCPWSGCNFRIEMVDFRVECMNRPDLYTRVQAGWYGPPGYAIHARCPGCGQYVAFSRMNKQAVPAPPPADSDVLPDDWHQIAFIA